MFAVFAALKRAIGCSSFRKTERPARWNSAKCANNPPSGELWKKEALPERPKPLIYLALSLPALECFGNFAALAGGAWCCGALSFHF